MSAPCTTQQLLHKKMEGLLLQTLLENYPCFCLNRSFSIDESKRYTDEECQDMIALDASYRVLRLNFNRGSTYQFDDGAGDVLLGNQEEIARHFLSRFFTKDTYYVKIRNLHHLIFKIPRNSRLSHTKEYRFNMVRFCNRGPEGTMVPTGGSIISVVPFQVMTRYARIKTIWEEICSTEEIKEPVYPFILLYAFDENTISYFIDAQGYPTIERKEQAESLSDISSSDDETEITEEDAPQAPPAAPAAPAQEIPVRVAVQGAQTVTTVVITITTTTTQN